MDHRTQQLIREVQRTGADAVYDLAVELLHSMSDEHRSKIHEVTSFYNARVTRDFTLLGERFRVANLPDSTIERLINEAQCIRRWRHYLKTGRRATGWDYVNGSYGTYIYEVILDEAEHRGLLSGHQKVWKKMRDRPSAKLLNAHFKMAQRCVKNRHEYMTVDEDFKCIHCHGVVRREEIVKQAHSMLRGRLRPYVC